MFSLPFIFTALLFLVIGVFALDKLLAEIAAAQSIGYLDTSINQARGALDIFNYGVLFIWTGLNITGFALSYQLRTSRVFILHSILLLAVNIFAAAEFANLFGAVASAGPLSAVASSFPMIEFFFSRLPLFTLAFGAVWIVLLYGKSGPGRRVGV